MGAAGAGVSGQATAGLVPISVGPPRRPGSQERRRGRVVWQLPPARGRTGSPGVSGRRPLSHPPCPGLAVDPCPAPPALGPPKLHPLRTWRHGHHGGTSLAAFPSLAVGSSILGFWGAAGDLSHSEFPAMGCCPLFCLSLSCATSLWGTWGVAGDQEPWRAQGRDTLWAQGPCYGACPMAVGLKRVSLPQGLGPCYGAGPMAIGGLGRCPPLRVGEPAMRQLLWLWELGTGTPLLGASPMTRMVALL